MKKRVQSFLMLVAAMMLTTAMWAQTYQAVPYNEGFESGSGTPPLPAGWVNYATGTSGSGTFPCAYEYAGNARNGNCYFEFETSTGGTQIAATPEFGNIAGLMVDFYAATSSNHPTAFEVGIMEDSTFVVVDTVEMTPGSYSWSFNYDHYRVYLNNYNGWGHRIAFRATGNSQYTVFMDDLVISPAPTCDEPISGLTVTADSNSATFNWQPATNSALYMVLLDGQWYNTTSTSYTVTGLIANTPYTVYVYNSCTGSDTSEAVSANFRTECGATVLPLAEDFDGYSGEFPSCWHLAESVLSYGTTYPFVYSGTSSAIHSGSYCLYFYPMEGLQTIASPRIGEDASTLETKFWARFGTTYGNASVAVGYASIFDSAATYVFVDTVDITSDFAEYTVSLGSLPAGSTNGYIIYRPVTASYGALYMDDIVIRTTRSCTTPTGLAVTGTTSGQLSFQITDTNATQNAWEIAVCSVGGDPDTVENYVNAATDTITVTGLFDSLTYQFYVRANCGSESSYWQGPVTARPNTFTMTADATDTLTACGVTILDDGGMNGNYAYSQNSMVVVYPTDNTQTVGLRGSINIYESYGYAYAHVYVYEGVGTTGRCLGDFTGLNDSVDVLSSVGPLTLRFSATGYSDYYSAPGFLLQTYCEDLASCTDPYDVEISGITGSSAIISWGYGEATTPNGFNIVVTDTASGNSINFTAPDTARTFILSGLDQTTNYVATIAADCGSDQSHPIAVSFKTNCLVGGEVVIGDVSSTTTNTRYIFDTYYRYSTNQMIIEATELTGVTDTIYGVKLNAISTNANPRTIAVYIDTTSLTGLTSFVQVDSASLAYAGTFSIAPGWNAITFDTPYVRPNQTSNLILTFDDNTGSYSSNTNWQMSAVSGKSLYISSDNTNVNPLDATTATGMNGCVRPNVMIVAPCGDASCVPPAVVFAGATPHSATINWVAGSTETAWKVEYRPASDTVWNVVSASTSALTATVNGLQPSTLYYFRVTSLCPGSDGSANTIVSGYTGCAAITALPFTEDFENFTASQDAPATQQCWHRAPIFASYGYAYYYPNVTNSYHVSGNKSMYFASDYYGSWLVLPEMGHQLDSLTLSFKFNGPYASSSYYTYSLAVGYILNPADSSTFVATDTITYVGDGSAWMEAEFNLSCPNDTSRYICIATIDDGGVIDDLRVDFKNPCPHALAFTVDSLSTTTASFHWTDTANIGSYTVKIASVNDPSAAFDSITTSQTHHTFTGLTRSTDYFVWIYSNCATCQSFALAGRFSTMATDVVSLPFVCDFEDTVEVFTFLQRAGSSPWYRGVAASNGGNQGLYISNDGGQTNAYTTSGAAVSFAYVPVRLADTTTYAISYDWRCVGESSYDKLRIALVPVSYDLTGAPTGYSDYGTSYSSTLPQGWIALDNGVMSASNTWQNVSLTADIAAGSYYLVLAWIQDGSGGDNPPAAVDNINFRALTCPAPQNLVAVSTQSTSIDVSWNAGNGTSWIVECQAAGAPRNSADTAIVTGASHTFNGLTPASPYIIYVTPICAANDTGFTGIVNVNTSCYDAAIADFPWMESFESDGSLTCWNQEYIQGEVDWAIATEAGSTYTNYVNSFQGSAFAKLIYSGHDRATRLISPMLSLSPAAPATLTFAHCQIDWGGDIDSLSVYYRTSPDAAWTLLQQYSGAINSWQVDTITLPEVSTTFQISFVGGLDYGYGIGIDSVVINGVGSGCAAPRASVASVDHESATIEWVGFSDNYEVSYTEYTSTNWSEPVAVAASQYTLTGLFASTQYIARVRAICDTNEVSGWSEVSFTTDSLPCFNVTNIRANATVSTVTLAWEDNAQSNASAWVVNIFNSTVNRLDTVRTNPATITGLYDNTEYSVAVQSMCAALVYSDWSDTITFTTSTCQPVTNVAVSNITGNGATITWTAGADETSWEVSYGDMDFTEGNGTNVTVTTTTYTISGLQEGHDYDVYVRAICGDGITSDWSSKKQFTTTAGQGIDGVDGNYSLSIYPNPTSGNTTISLRGVEGEVEISVVDMSGRLITSESLNCGADCVKSIDVANLAQGTYFVRVLGDGISSVRKLIVR